MSQKIEMVVFDMAGTTIKDENEVEKCFRDAANQTGITATHEQINSMMGWSKRFVFETLWKKLLPSSPEDEINEHATHSFTVFKKILETHYLTADVLPSHGCLEIFEFLKEKDIKIALTTGFYREVTDIILGRLGWNIGLNEQYRGKELINSSVTSDQVIRGRPSPFMIFRSMELCEVMDVRKIIKIGDTPSDLAEGKNAGCRYSLGITNGTHSKLNLAQFENDGLMDDLVHFKRFVEKILQQP
jgi:phosphonatase-like hydrolase